MKRNYPSGSEKRKAALEKKRKEDDLLKNIPKISSFVVLRSSASPIPSSSESSTSGSASETFVHEPNEESELVNVDETNPQLELEKDQDVQQHLVRTDVDEAASEEESVPSSDAALWPMDIGLHYLQSYWTEHGNVLHILFEFEAIDFVS